MLYILVGLPATGKSEVARILSKKTGATVLSEDETLRDLYPDPTHSESERQSVYAEMFRRATELLKEEKDVILDATFIKKANRDRARSLGEYKIIEVTAPEAQIKERLKKRSQVDGNDADWNVYMKYKKNFEPIFEHHQAFHNSGDLDKVREQLERVLNE